MKSKLPYSLVLAFLLAALFLPGLSGAVVLANTVTQAWFDSHHGQHAVGVVTDGSGNIYVAGTDYLEASGTGADDIVLIKYDLAGNRQWVRTFDETGDSTVGKDAAFWITLDPFGNILVTGKSYIYPTGETFITLKYDPSGNLLWKNRNIVGQPARMATDSTGNVYITGKNTNVKTSDFVTFKIDPNGKTLWTRTYNGPSNWIDQASSLSVKQDGRVAVTGNSEGAMVTIVYDTNGNQLWLRSFPSPDPAYILTSSDILFGQNGELYVGGSYLIQYDANGNLVWVKPDPAANPQGAMIHRLALDAVGNINVIGNFETANVLKFSPDGTKLWGKPFPGGLGSVATGADGAVYVTGTSSGAIYTVKYDANGNVQWETKFDHTPFDTDAGNGISLDSQGNVVVAGQRPILTTRYLQNGSPSPTPTATPAPQPTATPVSGSSLHSGDLDRSSALSTKGNWKATVTIRVEDASHKPVSGVTVSAAWSGGYTGAAACTTGSLGTCSMTSSNIRATKTSVTLSLNNLSKSGFTYNSSANHDPDGDSNGTTILVAKP